ncbi:MAG: ATP-binding cassette domain-containing protein [Proteobacteria bacterium]|nr:ATP-binding cassette domain-containing protein [Pseudomonadota bacterium]
MAVIAFENVALSYEKNQHVFRDVSFKVEAGAFFYLMGPSGSGKTSLIRLLYAGNLDYEGDIHIFGRSLQDMRPDEIPELRQQIGVIFQDFYLLDHLNALDNVALPLRIQGQSWAAARKSAAEVLEWIGLTENLDALPATMSGGQRQRLVIARGIINRPRILIADEPTGNLDDENALKLLYLFEELNRQGTTILFATHNRELMRAFPHDILFLKDGALSIESDTQLHPHIRSVRHG